MFLSKHAKELLKEKKYAELMALPLAELIDPESAKKVEASTFMLSPNISATQSCPSLAIDAINGETLVNPVAISSGHIFSFQMIDEWIKQHPNNPTCPKTRAPIDPHCLVPLPHITDAIGLWKLKNHLATNPPLNSSDLQLTIRVSGNKFRIIINGNIAPLQMMLDYIFSGHTNNVSDYPSYTAGDWSFAWATPQTQLKLEMWFPLHALSDDNINALIEQTLAPCDSAPVSDDDVLPTPTSINHLGPRVYVDVVENLFIDSDTAANVLIGFLKEARRLRQEKNPLTIFNGESTKSHAPIYTQADLRGVGMFGPAPAAPNLPQVPVSSAPVTANYSPATPHSQSTAHTRSHSISGILSSHSQSFSRRP